MENYEPHGTYVDILLERIRQCPKEVYTHLVKDNGEIMEITYQTLYEKSLQYAACFSHHGVGHGDRVIVILPTGAEFIYSFFGCYLTAACPVPAYPPFRLYDIPAYVKNLGHILTNCEPKVVVAFSQAAEIIQSAIYHSGLKIPLLLDEKLETFSPSAPFSPIKPSLNDLALLQYTSGSTGLQKGVMLNFRNLLINNEIASLHGNPDKERVLQVSWLPLYHDMGLISSLLISFYLCHPFVLMSPQYFLRDPKNWLWIIHRFRGTLSLAPNFAYSLCVKKIRDEEIRGLDLSSWNNAGCAAEPIDPATVEEFTRRFSKYGLPEEAITPYYGLAELTVAATGYPRKKKFLVDTIDRELMEKRGIAEPTRKKDGIRVVCVGPPLAWHDVKIIGEDGREIPYRHEGQVIISGPCVMQGYYRAPEVTAHVLKDGWVYTGDLGYLTDEGLYITGRKKDIIIKGGRNFYPHLIETATEEIEGIRKGCTVAFGVPNEKTGTEDIVILAETRLKLKDYRQHLQTRIREAILGTFQVRPDIIEILPPSALHKTSSGKIQRSACRESYLKGFFRKRRSRAWLSLLKIYGENRLQVFRGFFHDQKWSRIWQRPLRRKIAHYPVVEDALIEMPNHFNKMRLGERQPAPPCENFQRLLFYREQNNAREVYGHILEDNGQQRQLSYHDIYTEAQQYAFSLRKMGVVKGNRVVIILPKKDFITLFFACTLIGAAPVPIQPPFYLYEIQSYIQYLVHILDDCHPAVVVTFSDVREITQSAILKSRCRIPNANVESLRASKFRRVTPANITAEDEAWIHYTPGATKFPQSVTFTHANLLDNIRAIHQMLDIQKEDILVAWITLYETSSTMASLTAFWGNFPAVLISPDLALRNPKVWLWTIQKYRGTISLAPALFYQQCTELAEEEIRGLNLSCWRIALYGDDATVDTLERFANRFSGYGFDRAALVSCYIPEEVGLVSALTPPSQGLCVDHVNYQRFVSRREAVPESNAIDAIPCLSMGKPLPGYDIRIVDEKENPVSDGIEGEVLLQIPSPLKNYPHNAVKNGPLRDWVRTGDMGYFRQGYLYRTGRKDTIVHKNGHIFYPMLIESSVEEIEGIRPGGVVALGIKDEAEEVVILAEVQLGIRKTNYEITHEIQKVLEIRYNCCPDEIVLLPPHTLPRSLAGTISRSLCEENYLKGNLYKRHRRTWLEMLRIYSGNRLRRIQDAVKIWQWFRTWRERRRMHDNDPDVVQKEMARIIANEMDIALTQLRPDVALMKDLGLDSLKAIELLAIMEENFEVSIPNDSLEKYPTLSSLAAYICELRSDEGRRQELPAEGVSPAAKDLSESELLVLSAFNRNSLIAKIKALLTHLSGSSALLAQLCYNASLTEGNCRLGLVVDSREDLSAKLQEALDAISSAGEVDIEDPRGIYFFSQKRTTGKIAFLFPGQGVQYVGMLQKLRRCFPVVDKNFNHFDHILTEHGLKAISACISGEAGDLMQIQNSQPAIMVSDLALYELLLSLNLKPDMVAGHSYGEYIAAYAAGILDLQTIEKIGLAAGKLTWNEGTSSMAMAAISTSPEKVEDVVKIIPGSLFIANKNCALQTVISGDKVAVEQAVKIFRILKVMAELLPIPYAFHSPLSEPIYQNLRQSLKSIALKSPTLPIYSCTSGERYPNSSEQIASLLSEQIIQTVVFDRMIRNMYADGARVFIEVGPRNILTNFVKRILQDSPCCAVSSDHHLRPGISQLNHLLSLLAAQGIPFSRDAFYAHRNVVKDINIVKAMA